MKNKGFTSVNKIDLVDNNNIGVSDLSRKKLRTVVPVLLLRHQEDKNNLNNHQRNNFTQIK